MPLLEFLWTEDLASIARSTLRLCRFVQRWWRHLLLEHGFAPHLSASILPEQAVMLERWGGQGWDVWRHFEPGSEELILLRHWRFGSTVLLSGGSNGWFDFQVSTGNPPRVFYSSGAMEASDCPEDLVEQVGCTSVRRAPGTRPLLELPCEPYSCWRFKVETGHRLTVHHGLPGTLRAQQRLSFTESGFRAYGDNVPYRPCLVVDQGQVQ